VRTESAAERLLESEMVFVPEGLSSGSGGLIDNREATEVDEVTCLYDHGGYTVGDSTVPGEVDVPCHAPVLDEASEVDGGSGTPMSLREGEYRLVGSIGGEETVLRSYTVEAVEDVANESVTEEPDTGTETEEEEESDGGTGSEEADGSGGTGEDREETQDTLPIDLRDVGRYIGIGAAALVGFGVFVAFLVIVGRRLKEREWGGGGSEERGGRESMVLDTDSENEVYVSWSNMIERAGVEDIRTKTPSEIAKSAKEAGLNPEAVDELTDVFEEVRYRDAEPTAEQEERAKRALKRIEKSDGRE